MKYCIKCGEKLDNDSRFCTNCGEAIIPINKDRLYIPKAEKFDLPRQKSSKRKIWMIVAAVVFFFAACYLVYGGKTCDWCDKKFYGTAYYDCFAPETTFCEDCAKEYYTFGGYQNYKKQGEMEDGRIQFRGNQEEHF